MLMYFMSKDDNLLLQTGSLMYEILQITEFLSDEIKSNLPGLFYKAP